MSVPTKSVCVPLPFALSSTGTLVHASDQSLSRGGACGCTCLGCKERLILKRGSIKSPHFAHRSGSACSGGVGYWHKVAQLTLQLIPGIPLKSPKVEYSQESSILGCIWTVSDTIKLPSHLAVKSVTLEDRSILPGYVVDVSALTPTTTAGRLIIEIKDTHAIDYRKWLAIKNCGIPTVEIDISEIRKNPSLTSSVDNFVSFLLSAPRNWIVSLPEYESQRQSLKDELFQHVAKEERRHLGYERSVRLIVGPSMVRARALRGMASIRAAAPQSSKNPVMV